MRDRGEIVAWFEDRGYGFIRPDGSGGGGDVFLHGKQIVGGWPQKGAKVSFDTFISHKQRPVANKAEVL